MTFRRATLPTQWFLIMAVLLMAATVAPLAVLAILV